MSNAQIANMFKKRLLQIAKQHGGVYAGNGAYYGSGQGVYAGGADVMVGDWRGYLKEHLQNGEWDQYKSSHPTACYQDWVSALSLKYRSSGLAKGKDKIKRTYKRRAPVSKALVAPKKKLKLKKKVIRAEDLLEQKLLKNYLEGDGVMKRKRKIARKPSQWNMYIQGILRNSGMSLRQLMMSSQWEQVKADYHAMKGNGLARAFA